MSVLNSGSSMPKSLRLTNSSHFSHWLDTPAQTMKVNSSDTAVRTSMVLPLTAAW